MAPPSAHVGRDAVGGAECLLSQLDTALTRQGHESIVIAAEGSTTDGILVSTPPLPHIHDDAARTRAQTRYRRLIHELVANWSIDLVHLHGMDFMEYLPPPEVPVLVTLHRPLHWYPPEIFHLERPLTFLNCVSASQARGCPNSSILLPEIENGVHSDLHLTRHAKRHFGMSMGRICQEKGFHIALDAARQAKVPLLLAGQVFPDGAEANYFQREILPRLDGSRRFIGPVGLKRKRRLLSSARCLLAPSLVPEVSPLTAMEALACGTPVVAFRSGALGEIVEDGRTGFLVNDEAEMAEAVRAVGEIHPEACREAARERFSLDRVVREYFALYECLASYPHALECVPGQTREDPETCPAHAAF